MKTKIWIERDRLLSEDSSPNTGDTWYYVMFKPSQSAEPICLAQYSKSKKRALKFLINLKRIINSTKTVQFTSCNSFV